MRAVSSCDKHYGDSSFSCNMGDTRRQLIELITFICFCPRLTGVRAKWLTNEQLTGEQIS